MDKEKIFKLFERYIKQDGRLTVRPELKVQFDEFMKTGQRGELLADLDFDTLNQMTTIKMSEGGNNLRNNILNSENSFDFGAQDYKDSFQVGDENESLLGATGEYSHLPGESNEIPGIDENFNAEFEEKQKEFFSEDKGYTIEDGIITYNQEDDETDLTKEPTLAMYYQEGMPMKDGWTVDENNRIVKPDGTFVLPGSEDSAWMDEENQIDAYGGSVEGYLADMNADVAEATSGSSDDGGSGEGGWYPGKLLHKLMTDDKGLFQGGEEGRLFGRIRDMLGNPNKKDIDKKVSTDPDLKQVTKTRTNTPMVTGAQGSGFINPNAPGFNMKLFNNMPGIKPTTDELNQ
mgnify:FL=1